jgi:hypothetical protein
MPSPKTPANPRRGTDELDVKLAAAIEEKPWLTNVELGALLGLNEQTVRARRARKEWKALFDARNAPVKARWKEDLRPALRRRLTMIATSKNDTAAIELAERIMPEEVKPLPADRTPDEATAALSDLAHAFAAWIRGGAEGAGRADLPPEAAGKARAPRRGVAARDRTKALPGVAG